MIIISPKKSLILDGEQGLTGEKSRSGEEWRVDSTTQLSLNNFNASLLKNSVAQDRVSFLSHSPASFFDPMVSLLQQIAHEFPLFLFDQFEYSEGYIPSILTG